MKKITVDQSKVLKIDCIDCSGFCCCCFFFFFWGGGISKKKKKRASNCICPQSQTDAKMVKSAKINKSKELCYIQCVLVKCVYTTLLKGQVRSRISLISKEREIFPTERCKHEENRIKNNEVMTF